ncbi:MAG: RHS repeat-associated core domain-containing protein [Lachnospiraceae bacterium]|nr:RHS repeat-associated core domain-containing protein [Lachnospiraceae bacterium]
MRVKRIVCLSLVFTLLLISVTPAFAADLSVNDYLAMEADEITVNSGSVVINGYVDERKSDLKQGIISTLDYTDGTYAEDSVSYNGETAVFSGSLMSAGSIYVSSERMSNENFAVLYAEKDIVINCSVMELYGIIYAPSGTVYINAEDVNMVGPIIANRIVINAGSVEICPDEYSYRMYQYFWTYRNDGYMEWDCYPEDGAIFLDCSSNKELKSVTVYVRYEDNDAFELLGSTEGESGSVSGLREFQHLDIIAEGISKYGETVAANVLSFGYEGEELVRENRDADGDGIEDGIEIFYLGSNPNNADTDGDGFDDAMEVFWLNTDPLTWDEDADFDEDGVMNKAELENGTNVYLPDSDFDGISDKDDTESLIYNNSGNEIEYITHIELGVLDRVIVAYDENGERVQCVYDFVRNLRKMEIAQDYVTAYYYDYGSRLSAKVMNYNGEYFAASYTYKDGQVASFAKNGYLYEFAYDDKHNMLEATVNGSPLISFLREDGLAVRKTFGNGDVIAYDYENDVCTKLYINGTLAMETAADSYAERECMKYYFSDQEVIYEYDSEGQMSGLSIGENFRIDYAYEASDDAEQRTVTYTVCGESFSQIDSISANCVSSVMPSRAVVTYDSTETCVMKTLNGQTSSWSTQYFYNEYNEVKRLVCEDTEYTYNYDENGNLISIEENGVLQKEYQYDVLRRLTEVRDYEQELRFTYSYDLSGNLLKKKTYTLNAITVDDKDYLYSATFKDRMLSYNGGNCSYDALGNPLVYKGNYHLGWTGDKLTEANYDGKQMEFFYNSDGFLTKKVVDGIVTEYFIEGSDYIAEVTGEETMIFMYDAYASLVGFLWNDEEYYYVKNVWNDVVAILDDSFKILCEYEYDAWGSVITITGDVELAEANPYRYRGYYYDTDLNLYYLRSRYYDSETGRFVSPDSIDMILQEGNDNLYAYCGNNPVNYDDQLGMVARKVYVIASTTESRFVSEAKKLGVDIEAYFTKNGDSVSIKYCNTNSYDEFKDVWFNMLGYDVVVLNGHGNQYSMTTGGLSCIPGNNNINSVNNQLQYRTIKMLILLGCNCGHYDYREENLAYALSTRISGYVVASDGTVISYGRKYSLYGDVYLPVGLMKWGSKADNAFLDLCTTSRNYNWGWIAYKNKSGKEVQIKLSKFEVSMISIIEFMKENSYFK